MRQAAQTGGKADAVIFKRNDVVGAGRARDIRAAIVKLQRDYRGRGPLLQRQVMP